MDGFDFGKYERHQEMVSWQGFGTSASLDGASLKGSTDGDNLKVIVNGKTQQNSHAPESYKYKNFYFSGDIKEFDIFSITSDKLAQPLAFENAVELWYDEEPEIANLHIEYFDNEEFLERLKDLVDLREYALDRAHKAISFFRILGRTYSAQFLEHALKTNPTPLIFNSSNHLIRKIKADLIYKKILEKLKEEISHGNLDGEIWPEEIQGEIIFRSPDLATSLHGIRKIEYKAKPKGKHIFQVELVFFDIYDFKRENLPSPLAHPIQYLINTINNAVDLGEEIEVIHNFEIEIYITDTILI